MIKRFYLKLEAWGTQRPIILAIIAASLPFISNAVIPKEINLFLSYHKLNASLILGLFSLQLFTLIITIAYFKTKNSKKHFLKKIDAVLVKLNSPFERDYTSFGGPIKKEKFYDSELGKSFEEYNQILIDVKNKWPKKYDDLILLKNLKNIGIGTDWIPESELNGVKVSLLQLKERIN